MCYNAKFLLEKSLKRARYNNIQEDIEYFESELRRRFKEYKRLYSGFAHPQVIIYTNNEQFKPILSTWGLIPDWAKEPSKIWNQTINARGETIFEKPAFRKSASTKRCLIPAAGFYEFHDYKGKKYPFYITQKDEKPLYFAGLWNEWPNPDTGVLLNTFTIVTTRANPLMAKIHNKPQYSDDPRMPVILPDNLLEEWLKPLDKVQLQELLQPYPDSELEAYTVHKLTGKEAIEDNPDIDERREYDDLVFGNDQLSLF